MGDCKKMSKKNKKETLALLDKVENGISSLAGIFHAVFTMTNLPEPGKSNIDKLFATYLEDTLKNLKELKKKLE
jgi:hypothetical protein